MKKIIDYLPLLSICLVYFGFCNLHGYYKCFQVDIYAYITTSEIIMAFFPAIVFLSSILSSSLIQYFIGEPIFEKVEVSEQQTESPSEFNIYFTKAMNSIFAWLLIFFALNFGIRWVLRNLFGFELYDFQTYNIFAALFFLLTIMGYVAYTDKREVFRENPGTLAIIIVCFVGIQISSYRELDAMKIKAGIPLHQMNFRYHNSTISTNKNLMFVGQTSGHLFFYERKAKNTLVLKASEVDSVLIRN